MAAGPVEEEEEEEDGVGKVGGFQLVVVINLYPSAREQAAV